jgi:hypothetical protein
MVADRFTVIVENDITRWNDETGVSYHYPRRYRGLLEPGTRLIHYKGKLRDAAFRGRRLSEHPHYFGLSVAGESRDDPASSKGDLILDIVGLLGSPLMEEITAATASLQRRLLLKKIEKARTAADVEEWPALPNVSHQAALRPLRPDLAVHELRTIGDARIAPYS